MRVRGTSVVPRVILSESHFSLISFTYTNATTFRACKYLPSMFQEFLNEMHSITGWVFTALIGGPNGEKGGDIDIAR